MPETTALGAAIAAGLAVGVWKSLEDLYGVNSEGRMVFKPKIDAEKSASMFGRWEKAVNMSKGWL
jgi:glycerol kinase